MTPTPVYVGMNLYGVPVGPDLFDYEDAAGVYPAGIEFVFMDASFTTQCFVLYDADDVVRASPSDWSTDGGALYGAWEIVPGGGWTDCGPVSAGVFGTTDLREWISGVGTLGVGVGEMTPKFLGPLRTAVADSGGDWAADWAPYVFSSYLARDGVSLEMGYAFSYPQECGALIGAAPAPAPVSSVDDVLVNTRTFFVFYVDAWM
jgi:hypothetical protein